ncbi:MAG: amidohydrolase family protein [Anaerolineae bacterium]|jgi:cytosine/adenosine deaminase-related metal-dependent hydrolase/adenylate cyclase class IV|nr:amidohydrolase family protein [Anaerolineae bacterium]MDX9829686.1 amidohydrolase family protein [Anaerolineae bacterium]
MTVNPADLILANGVVVTMNAPGDLFARGAVAIRGREIVAVGPADDVLAGWQAPEVVDCEGAAIMPGLINAHAHVPMSLLRGLADDLRLDVWLFGYMLPVEREFVSPEFCRWGTLLSCAEMIRSGVTTFADMYYYEADVAQSAAEAGMRAICAETIMKWPTPDAESYDESLARCRAFIEAWKDHPLVTPAVGPHAPESSTTELLEAAAQLALEHDVPFLIHIAETAGGVEETQSLFGASPVEVLERLGVLKARVLAAHCVHVTKQDREIMARHGVGVAHNPTSNLKLASGLADVVGMQNAGLAVGIGTDGQASNNDQDMFEEMRLAALLPKGLTQDPTVVPASRALAMATIEGARALGLDDITGSLEPGKRADLVVVRLDAVHNVPRFELSGNNVYSQLVYAAKAHDVEHVLVDGRWLMRNRDLLTLDEVQVRTEAQRIAGQVGAFLARREQSLLDKLVALGALHWGETYEVQVKARVPDEASLLHAFEHCPEVMVIKPSERKQYDTYFFFGDQEAGQVRYREDYLLDRGLEVRPLYSLTLRGPMSEREYADSVLLSRSRFTADADRSLRFYREYFQPQDEKRVDKLRRRWRIKYQGVDFALNLDRLTQPASDDLYLEIKARTWSKQDAVQKAEMISALLDVLGVDKTGLVRDEYVSF